MEANSTAAPALGAGERSTTRKAQSPEAGRLEGVEM